MKCDELISRHVSVNRTRTPQAALSATGRKQSVYMSIVSDMPRGEGEDTEVIFFQIGRFMTNGELEKEYELRGLTPADPYSLAAVNEVDPTFADEHSNTTYWMDSNGRQWFATFGQCYGERTLYVHSPKAGWDGRYWFAGLRK